MYLAASIIQFVVEICLFETMECVWINCAIPALVSNEVRTVGDSIMEIVQQLCSNGLAHSDLFLNAPDYLFVSTNVAKAFPNVMESILVQTYCSHLPGELSKTWQVGSIARIRRRQNLRNTTLLASILVGLQYIGTAPFIFHRMFVRFVQPFVFSGLVLLWQLITSDPIYIGAACGTIVLLIAAIVYWSYYGASSPARPLSHISPNDDFIGNKQQEMVRARGAIQPNAATVQGRSSQKASSLQTPHMHMHIGSSSQDSGGHLHQPRTVLLAALDSVDASDCRSHSESVSDSCEDDKAAECDLYNTEHPPLHKSPRHVNHKQQRRVKGENARVSSHQKSSYATSSDSGSVVADSFSELSAGTENERRLRAKIVSAHRLEGRTNDRKRYYLTSSSDSDCSESSDDGGSSSDSDSGISGEKSYTDAH